MERTLRVKVQSKRRGWRRWVRAFKGFFQLQVDEGLGLGSGLGLGFEGREKRRVLGFGSRARALVRVSSSRRKRVLE